jgi:hypothetical protein
MKIEFAEIRDSGQAASRTYDALTDCLMDGFGGRRATPQAVGKKTQEPADVPRLEMAS